MSKHNKEIEYKLLEPTKGCKNPIKCYWPNIEHEYCTNSTITTAKNMKLSVWLRLNKRG